MPDRKLFVAHYAPNKMVGPKYSLERPSNHRKTVSDAFVTGIYDRCHPRRTGVGAANPAAV